EGRTLESDGPDDLEQAGQDQHEPRHQPVRSSPEILRPMMHASRRRIRSSLPMPKPPDTTASTAVVPRVPMPVKTAYTVPTGRNLAARMRRSKLSKRAAITRIDGTCGYLNPEAHTISMAPPAVTIHQALAGFAGGCAKMTLCSGTRSRSASPREAGTVFSFLYLPPAKNAAKNGDKAKRAWTARPAVQNACANRLLGS